MSKLISALLRISAYALAMSSHEWTGTDASTTEFRGSLTDKPTPSDVEKCRTYAPNADHELGENESLCHAGGYKEASAGASTTKARAEPAARLHTSAERVDSGRANRGVRHRMASWEQEVAHGAGEEYEEPFGHQGYKLYEMRACWNHGVELPIRRIVELDEDLLV
ncbi:hypothetical protein FRC08_016599 [Ceratobasidium sp. 394]|nr:hypothetical protein FRC08_016599 [Ceratobasidium sp. 394]KAG9099338.1 hypothetical protein FS749_001483 [Ceratobasidium sp. UAMH 11750]